MEELAVVLRTSISQHQTEFAPAADKLKELEASMSGFYHNLLEISLMSEQIEPDVRLAALLQLKNGIEKRWRAYCINPLSNEEKTAIKEKILMCLDEKVPRVARQFSYVVSRIARYDYPESWSALMPHLFSRLCQFQCNNPTYSSYLTFMTLRMVLTELASRQLMAQRSKLQETCQNCLPVLLQSWDVTHQAVLNMLTTTGLSHEDPRTLLLLDIDINIEKSLRRIARRLDSENLYQLLKAVVLAQRSLCEITTQVQQLSDVIVERYNKILITLSKICLEVLDCKPPSSLGGEIVPEIMHFCKRCLLVGSENRQVLPQRFLVNCMNQMKQIIQETSNDKSNVSEHQQSPPFEWTNEELQELIKCLIFKYFPLSSEDLELWNDDIIDFCTEEIGESWRYNIKPAAEVLFITLLREKSAQICSMIFETIDYLKQQDRKDEISLNTVIMECAIYKSLSLSASELFDSFDFEDYFEQTLIQRVQQVQNQPYGKIIHRGVLQLLTAWMDIRPFTKAIKTTWQFISASLNSQLDFAVRFEAANALKIFLYDFENDISFFRPYQEDCVRSLNIMLEESNDDLKMQILDVFNRIIERTDNTTDIQFIIDLAQVLQNIWNNSEKHEMLRCSVLVTMTNVVEASREMSCHLQNIALPMIHLSCNVDSKDHVYLMIDGLELWTSIMHHTDLLTPQLLNLFTFAIPPLEQGCEEARLAFHICECYLLLGGADFVNDRSFDALARSINYACSDMAEEILGYATNVIDSALQISPRVTGEKLGKCLIYLHQQVLNNLIHGSKRTSILLLGIWLNILDSESGADLLRQIFEQMDYGMATYKFVQLISNSIDTFVEAEQKKAACMSIILAMDRLTNVNIFQRCLPEAICTCVQTLHDVCDSESGRDEVMITDGEDDCGEQVVVLGGDGNKHQIRCRQLLRAKPTLNYSLPQFITTHLNQWAAAGKFFPKTQDFNLFLTSNVDSLILEELNTFLTANPQ